MVVRKLGPLRTLAVLLGLLPASLAAGPSPSPPQKMRVEHLSIEDGLSQSVVNCIFQDSTGFLWLGTQGGLNRYDGYGFEVYRHDPEDPTSLPHDLVMAVAEDPSGDLWVGTEGGGLARWRRASDTFTTYLHHPDDPGSLPGDEVVDLAWDSGGTLWIGTRDAGLARFDAATETFQSFRHRPSDPSSLADDRVRTIYEDRNGWLWVGTLGGLDRLTGNPRQPTFVHYRHDPDDPKSLSHDSIRAIVEDRRGALWIGTEDGGLNRLDPDSGRCQRYLHDLEDPGSLSHDWVRSLFVDREGHLWIGTDGGLNLWREASGSFASYHPDSGDPDSLSSDQIIDIFQDRSGVLWFSTAFAGLSKWNPVTWSFPHYRSSGDVDGVLAISEDRDGGLCIGTSGGGIERLDRATGRRVRFTHDSRDPRSLSDDRVTAILHDRQGSLWAGTLAGGLNRFDPATGGFEHFRHDPKSPGSLSSNAVTTIHQDRHDRLWVGTLDYGLNLANGDGSFTHHRHDPADPASLASDRILSLAEDPVGRLWLATLGGGLNRLDPGSGTVLRLKHDPDDVSSLASDDLNVVHVDASGRLWVGTGGRGLEKLVSLDETRKRAVFKHYTRRDGLPDETISGIRSDDAGNLWISTNNGLSRLDPVAEVFTNYNVSHGLQSKEFNLGAHFKSPSGELFFGGVNGLNAFYPDRITYDPRVPPVVVTAITKVNKPVRSARPTFDVEEVYLDHNDYFFSVEVAALDFTAPQENRYQYKLENFDDDWVDLGQRRLVTFTNLDPGRYVLRLRGSNNDGVWNEEGASLAIVVAPPPWRTWWAYALYVVALAAVARGVGHVYAQRRQAERDRVLAEYDLAAAEREREQVRERERLIAERERLSEERERLITELEEKNAALESFNYTVSHDLQNPLVTIRGFVGVMEQDLDAGDTERIRKDLHYIDGAAEKMSNLIRELLKLSRIQRQDDRFEEVALAELVPDALGMVAGLIAERGVEVDVAPDLPVVVGDRLQLLEVYQNLLANAARYMGDQPEPHIEVGARRDGSTAADGTATAGTVLYVRDNGIGIEPEFHRKVFGIFQRLETGEEGTGVGLAVVKRIVELHRGRVWVESQGAGRGSTFCFTLRPSAAAA